MNIVIITGMSGSGKSVALHALEDIGYFCVDNLPPELLQDFVALEHKQQASHVAIATDARSGASLQLVTEQLQALRAQGHSVRAIFLDASTTTLVRRYSETRRKHPLAQTRSGEASLEGEELRRGNRRVVPQHAQRQVRASNDLCTVHPGPREALPQRGRNLQLVWSGAIHCPYFAWKPPSTLSM